MEIDYYTIAEEFTKARTASKLEIKKFNREGQLCYYDSIDLTGKGFTDLQVETVSKLFISAGFKVCVKTHTYFGIYDPSRNAQLIEIYPTDEELIKKI